MSAPPPIPAHLLQQVQAQAQAQAASTPPPVDDKKAKLQAALAQMAAKTGLRIAAAGEGEGILGKRKPEDFGAGRRLRKKVYVPVQDFPDVNFFGLLIGPRGATQKQLEEESGARILLRGRGAAKDDNEPDSNEDLHVLISADTDDQLAKAERLVYDLIHDPDQRNILKRQQLRTVAELNGNLREGESPANSIDNNNNSNKLRLPDGLYAEGPQGGGRTSEIVLVPNGQVGLLIGRGGDTIKNLQQSTGCHVQIAKAEECEPGQDRRVTLEGTHDAIERAKVEIRRIVSHERGPSNSRPGLGFGGRNMNDIPLGAVETRMSVPNNLVGLLIGKQGDTIRQLQARTGCAINVQRDAEADPQTGLREVTLVGTHEQIETAKAEIHRVLHAQEQGRSSDRSGSTTVTMKVSSTSIGSLIGRGGETIKRLQSHTGAKIQISPDQTLPEREVTLSGGHAEVERARAEIMALISDRQSRPPPVGYGPNPYGYAPAPAPYPYPPQPYDYSAYYAQHAPPPAHHPGGAPPAPSGAPAPHAPPPPSAAPPPAAATPESAAGSPPPQAADGAASAQQPAAGGYDYAAYQRYMQDPAYAAYYQQYYQQYYANYPGGAAAAMAAAQGAAAGSAPPSTNTAAPAPAASSVPPPSSSPSDPASAASSSSSDPAPSPEQSQ